MLTAQSLDAIHYLRRAEAERAWFERLVTAPAGAADLNAALDEMSRSVQAEFRRAQVTLTLSGAAAGVALAVAFVAGNRTVRTIRKLARAASALAVGDYRRRIAVRTGDELESLGESFNALGESLLERDQTFKEQAEMLAGMVEAARVASASLDARECGGAIANAVCAHLGASDAVVFRKDTDDGGVRAVGRCGSRHGADWRRLAAHSAESGDYLVIAEQDSALAGGQEALLVGTPLVTGAETLGSIVARFGDGLARDDLRLGSLRADVLRAFAIHAAAAVANAEVHQRTEKYSEALEDWVEHVSAVMRVTEAISASLNLQEALAALAAATASTMNADECVIFLPDREGNLIIRSCFASDARRQDLLQTKLRPGESISGQAFAQKNCAACRDAQASDDESTRRFGVGGGFRGVLSAPLIVGDEAIGAITLYCFEPREFHRKDTQLLMSIALHAAVVVRNAKLYTMEATIAERLQTSLASEAPERCRGLGFAGRYIPALDEASVGGDFYDVTPLPNGKVAVAIADVSGKGLEAAMHLAACKYMLKALAYSYPDDPAAVLGQLNNAINYYFHYDFFLTAFYAVIDPETGTILFANAGHPPAFLVTENANMHTCLTSTGIPLGAGPACRYHVQSVTARPGDVLLLYTDGATDAVKDGVRLDLEGVHKMVFEAGRCSGAELVDRLYEQLSTNLDPHRKDDVALLAVSFDSAVNVSEVGGSLGGEQRSITSQTG